MKKLILFILIPFLTLAQKDSIKVIFSEEKVANFEKTTLLDEYEKAFGGNRVVKSGLRYSFGKTVQFEKKIAIDKSIIGGFSSGLGSLTSFYRFDIEPRWYYKMKERLNLGMQNANITGKYLSVKYQYISFTTPFFYLTNIGFFSSINPFMFRETSSLSLNWGRKFGNNVDFGLAIGIKNGKESYINSKEIWVNDNFSPLKSSWFISTYSQMGFGLYFPRKKSISNNYCEFLRCNYEVKHLLKINVSGAFYFDKYSQKLKADVAYERKIANSPFSLNSNLIISLNNYYKYQQIGSRDSIINKTQYTFSTIQIPLFSSKKENTILYSFEINEQLRYYLNLKQRIAKGKSANNLNGIYTGLQISCTYNKYFYSYPLTTFYPNPIFGGTFGYQTQTNRKSFLDVSFFIGKPVKFFQLNNNGPFFLELNLKLGFAK